MHKQRLALMWLKMILPLFFFALVAGQCTPSTDTKVAPAGIKIPTEWIERVRGYDYKENNLPLLKQLEGFIKPDTLAGETDSVHIGRGVIGPPLGGIFNPIFVNLDEDPTVELIGIFGYTGHEPILAVFKMLDNSWYLIYREPFFIFNEETGIQVVNTPSINKTFYMRVLHERGSGIYRDAYQFYKLIYNKVYRCLELTNESRIYGWGLRLNQDIHLRLDFSSTSSDEVGVTYAYRFFPGPGYKFSAQDNSQSDDDAAFVTGENGVPYTWNAASHTYQPNPFTYPGMPHDEASLTPDAVACFGQFGNDSLFIRAFDYEIQQTLRSGTKEQKGYLQEYMKFAKSRNRTNTARENALEEKSQANGMKFYGPKRK